MRVALLALLLFLVPVALAGGDGTPDPYVTIDGARYYAAYGALGSASMSIGPAYDGQGLLPFDGCAFALLRPDLKHGAALVSGQLYDKTPLTLVLGDTDASVPGGFAGVMTNVTLNGTQDHGKPWYPSVKADAAFWSSSEGLIDHANFTDPVGGGHFLHASLFTTSQGFRDDASKGIPLKAGGWFDPAKPSEPARIVQGDQEMHLHLQSPAGAVAGSDALALAPAGDLPDGSFSNNADYTALTSFEDTRFGGQATLHFALDAKAPPGFNSLTFAVASPSGVHLGEKTLTADLLAGGAADLTFPLTEFGAYTVLVKGKMTLATYRIDATLQAPATFDANLWWENVTYGRQARDDFDACQQKLGNFAALAGNTVGQHQPPGFPLRAVLLGVVVTTISALVAIKLLHDQAATSTLRKSFNRR